jgi:hypothetical protein
MGEVDEQKAQTAERKRDYLNWQIDGADRRVPRRAGATADPVASGWIAVPQTLVRRATRSAHVAEFVPIDRVIVPFAATNFYTAQRAAEIHEITE